MRKIKVCAIVLLTIFSSAIQSDQITGLQDQFRKLGGKVVYNENFLSSEYRYPGRSEMPFKVAEILQSLRNVHLEKAEESIQRNQYVGQILSALSANQAGRNFLQLERDNTSLLDVTKRYSISTILRDFYDKEVDLGWFFLNDEPDDITTINAMFRSAELSRARDFMGSVYRRMDLSSRPEEEQAFAKLMAYLDYQEALAAIQNYENSGGSSNRYLPDLKETIRKRAENIDINNLRQFDVPGMGNTGVMTASKRANSLGIGEAMIMYHLTAKNAYAFILVRNAPPQLIRLPIDTDRLRMNILSFHEQLSSDPAGRNVTPVTGSANNLWRETGQKLYDVLFAPLAPFLHGVDRLNIVPHEYIHLVPFAALPISENSNSFLVDRYTIIISPTPMYAGWSVMRRRDPTKMAMIVGINEFALANSLNYAEEEANGIAKVLEGCDLLLGSKGQATYRNVMDNLEEYWIIHIASHGTYIPYAPGASLVVLQGQRQQHDEPLMAIDVTGKHLNASLIILSACNTATSDIKGLPPDGDILGLPRSFLIAGAERVIASLWSVNDRASSEFFEYFYRRAFSGSAGGGAMLIPKVDMDIALAITQRYIKSKYPDPHYWAPFTLVGVP